VPSGPRPIIAIVIFVQVQARTQEGTVLQPTVMGKWLVTFCDECNLPAADKYGTQRVITFLRQLVEQNGFVGACNPPRAKVDGDLGVLACVKSSFWVAAASYIVVCQPTVPHHLRCAVSSWCGVVWC